MSPRQPSLILATSNGTGMGHLARQLAVGLAADPRARVTLFSLSVALPTVTTQGIPGEYCPGPDRGWIPEVSWAHYLAGRLTALAEEVKADVIVFDGVAPYRGITLAKKRLPGTAFVWFRRGMWRPGVNEGQLWKSGLFDMIIEPGDLASGGDRGATAGRDDAVRVPPVSLIEVVDRYTREEAAARLGIDPERPALLLTLGTGRLGEVAAPGQTVVRTIREAPEYQVCVATSAVARKTVPAAGDLQVIELRGIFPLVRYLNAFDAVISAAGYNAVHEYIPAGLPTLLVPNTATQTDDQAGRASVVSKRGLALSAPGDAPDVLADTVRDLMRSDTRAELAGHVASLHPSEKTGGASATANALIDLAHSHTPQPRSLGTFLLDTRDAAKESFKRRLGPRGTNTVRRLLGRPEYPITDRMRVALDSRPEDPGVHRLHVTSSPEVSQLLGEEPVEHALAGSSASYMSVRDLLIDRHYEVVDHR